MSRRQSPAQDGNRGGRPRHGKALLNRTVTANVSEEEHAKLKAAAVGAGVPLSSYARGLLLDRAPKQRRSGRAIEVPSDVRQGWSVTALELKRWGVNLNQMAKRLNADPDPSMNSDEREQLREMRKVLEKAEEVAVKMFEVLA